MNEKWRNLVNLLLQSLFLYSRLASSPVPTIGTELECAMIYQMVSFLPPNSRYPCRQLSRYLPVRQVCRVAWMSVALCRIKDTPLKRKYEVVPISFYWCYVVMLRLILDQSPSSPAEDVRKQLGGTRRECSAMAVISGTTLAVSTCLHLSTSACQRATYPGCALLVAPLLPLLKHRGQLLQVCTSDVNFPSP